jgi:uncharacterized protein (TIGR02452 family)
MAKQSRNRTIRAEQVDSEDTSSLIFLSRHERARIAEDTLDKLKAGRYRLPDGSQINLGKDVEFCMDNSLLYSEESLQNTNKLILTVDKTDPTSSTTATASSSYTNIEVRHCTTLQAAQSLVAEMGEDHVGVLNFASAKNPGGGFLRGANAQEESIVRSSSLYSVLTQTRFLTGYYNYNRAGRSGIYSHRIIYSPRVTIFKVGEVLPVCFISLLSLFKG